MAKWCTSSCLPPQKDGTRNKKDRDLNVWRNRHKIAAAVRELGCGFLTVLFITIPVWVLTLAWRGPAFALAALAVLLAVLIGFTYLSRLLDR
jgi:hypothetical protein